MTVQETIFGQFEDQNIYKYTLENRNQTRLSVLSYAGIIAEFSVLDADKRVNLVLSFPDLAGFTDSGYNFNRFIGRHAGRIGNARWQSDAGEVIVPANELGNSLHGGPHGMGEQVFAGRVDDANNAVELVKVMTPTDDGYPGTLAVTVRYELTDDDQVVITMTGTQADVTGVFNPTVHTYFNLSDETVTDVMQMSLQVNSATRLELRDDKVPTGKFIPVANSIYDFNTPVHLGPRLGQFQVQTVEKGLDDAFVVVGDLAKPAAVVRDSSGREVTIYSDRNAIVCYTANDLNDPSMDLNRGPGHPYEGLAIEAQNLPDAMNHDDFGDVILVPGLTATHQIIYQYRHQ